MIIRHFSSMKSAYRLFVRNIFVLMVFLALLGAGQAEAYRVIGYFPYWRHSFISSIDFNQFTHLNYFHIWPNSNGSLDTQGVNTSNLSDFVNQAHAAGVTVSISVGGAGVSDGFPAMAASASARTTFIQNIVNYIQDNNLDGVDLDWEWAWNEDYTDDHSTLIEELNTALDVDGKLLSVAVNAERVIIRDWAIDDLDWVGLMTYDLNWPNAEHSTYQSMLNGIALYSNIGVPAHKMVAGVPFYGRNDGWSSFVNYVDLESQCNLSHADNYCDGHFFNGWDLIQQKAQHIVDNNYAGMMIWEITADVFDNNNMSLTIALTYILNNATPTNNDPVAGFSYSTSVSNLIADFTDNSTDSDGIIVGWSWDFGDGSTSTVQNPSHTYAADGTYTVTLTVTDDQGATGSSSQDLSVCLDSDGDGVCDTQDQCPGFDDNEDANGNGIPDDCEDPCVEYTANFTPNPLTHSGTGSNSTTLDLPDNSQNVSFTISNISKKTKPASKQYSELVTVNYIDGGGNNVPYGSFSADEGSSFNVDIVGQVQSVTVSLTDQVDGDSGSSIMSISFSPVIYCIESTPCTDSDADGVCDAQDQCPGQDDAIIGTSCDDGNACTTNDVYINCVDCAGTYTDADGDGVCVGDDPDDNDGCIPDETSSACSSSPCNDIINDSFETDFGNWYSGGKYATRVTKYANTGDYCIKLVDNEVAASSMYSIPLDLSTLSEVSVNFSFYPRSMESGEDFMLEISIDGGATYSMYKSWASGTDFFNNTRYNIEVPITGISFTDNTVFRIRCDASGKIDEIYIDDVVITECVSQ